MVTTQATGIVDRGAVALPDPDAIRTHIDHLDREAAAYRKLLRAVLTIDRTKSDPAVEVTQCPRN